MGLCGALLAGAATSGDSAGARLDKLYAAYVGGDLTEARRSLHDSIAILQKAHFPNVAAQAHGLWLAHSRLAVLEKRAGNASLAEAHLLKARFWYLEKLELSGKPTQEAMLAVLAYDARKCEEVVDTFDKAHTGELGAKYSRNE